MDPPLRPLIYPHVDTPVVYNSCTDRDRCRTIAGSRGSQPDQSRSLQELWTHPAKGASVDVVGAREEPGAPRPVVVRAVVSGHRLSVR